MSDGSSTASTSLSASGPTEPVTSVTASFRPPWLLGAGLVAANGLAWLLMRRYSFSGNEGVQALLVGDTLVAVLWYAMLTSKQVVISAAQLQLVNDQLQLANKQLALANDQHRQSKLAYVIIDMRPEPTGGHYYYLRNIGSGPALNVIHSVADPTQDKEKWDHMGSVPAGGEVRIADPLYAQLEGNRRDPFNRHRHLLRVESVDGSWTVSENVMEDGAGRMSHVCRDLELSPEQKARFLKETLTEAMHRMFTKLQMEDSGGATGPSIG